MVIRECLKLCGLSKKEQGEAMLSLSVMGGVREFLEAFNKPFAVTVSPLSNNLINEKTTPRGEKFYFLVYLVRVR